MSVEIQVVELRCPAGPKALLAKIVRQHGERPVYTSDGLMELHCRDCTKLLRKNNPKVLRVVHRYNILGELVESLKQES